MEHKDLELIERYVLRIMSEEEINAFELRLKTDSNLKAELNDYQFAINLFKHNQAINAKDRLVKLENKILKKERKIKFFKYSVIGFVLVLSFLILYFINFKGTSPSVNHTADTLQLKKITVDSGHQKTSALSKDSTIIKPEGNKIRVDRKTNNTDYESASISTDQLFVMNYEPYWDESMQLDTRGENNGYLEQFYEFYYKKEYKKSLIVFDSLSETLKRNDNILFIKAMASMAIDDTYKAQIIISKILNNKRSRFTSQSEWYLALIYIKQNKLQNANQLLSKIRNEEHHIYRNKADRLFKNIQPLTQESKKNE